MFRGFQNFVNDLEASARQNSVNQTGQPQVVSPPASARGSPGPQSPTNSNAQLAENALSGLRKSFRGSGVGRPSQDSPRTGSADWGRWGSRPSSPAQPPNKPKIPIPVEKHKQLEAATSQPEPEPAPWPPEAPELDEEQFKVSEERLRKAIQVELPPDPPEPSVAEIPRE